jgi:hypothetical protein
MWTTKSKWVVSFPNLILKIDKGLDILSSFFFHTTQHFYDVNNLSNFHELGELHCAKARISCSWSWVRTWQFEHSIS